MSKTRALSRQRRWQLKMMAEGRCVKCGAPRESGAYCRVHLDAEAARQRARRLAVAEAKNQAKDSSFVNLIAENAEGKQVPTYIILDSDKRGSWGR